MLGGECGRWGGVGEACGELGFKWIETVATADMVHGVSAVKKV